VGSGPVEGVFGVYNIITMGVGTTALLQKGSATQSLIPADFDLKDITQAPTNTFNTAALIVPQIFSCFPSSTSSKIFWRFVKPANSKFRGFDIRWRPVTPGSNPAFNTVNTGTTLEGSTNNIFFTLEDARYSHSTKYQWQIVARYADGSATGADADSCLFTQAAVPFNLASSTPLVPNILQFEVKDTKVINGELTTVFPAAKSLFANRWIKRQITASTTRRIESAGSTSIDMVKDSLGQPRLNAWYTLEFQAPNDTFTDLVCYRRLFNPGGLTRTTVGSFAKYYTLGAWEKVTIPRTTGMSYNATTGFYTVNIRGVIDSSLFHPYYQVSGNTASLRQPYYGAGGSFPAYTSSPTTSDVYPYYGVGNKNDGSGTGAEFLFVLKEGGTEGTQALRLTEFFTDMSNQAGNFRTEVDGIQTANIPKDQFVTLANFNNLDAGYLRNLNEAISNVAVGKLSGSGFWGTPGGLVVPELTSSWTAFKYFLQDPVGFDSGTTKVH
jgi:hypothetical protein